MNKFKWKFQKKLNRESSERLLSLLGSSAVPGSSTQGPSHELQKDIIRETKERQKTGLSNSGASHGVEEKTSENSDKGLIPKWVKIAILGGTISSVAFFGITKLFKKIQEKDD
jgi:hypothetical protein